MELEIGKVNHYYDHIQVAVLTLNDSLKLGDTIHIIGHSTDFTQQVTSMELDHHAILWVKPGQDVAIKVNQPVHEHDLVLRVVEEALEFTA